MPKPSKQGGERARASVSPDAVRHHVAGYFTPTPEGPGPHLPYLGSPPADCKSARPAPPYSDEGANPVSVGIQEEDQNNNERGKDEVGRVTHGGRRVSKKKNQE